MSAMPLLRQHRWVCLWLGFAIMAVLSGIFQLSLTSDESIHARSGMEWWQKGTYTIQALHPPLGRVADAMFLAAGEWIMGGEVQEGMHPRDGYVLRMALMRLGVLPFYLFSCVIVWQWGRRLFGEGAALWALFLYVTTSSVTGHAMLATTDMPYTAMLLWALYVFWGWLRAPSGRSSFWLGVSVAAALGSKYSALMHLPVGFLLLFADFSWRHRQHAKERLRTYVRQGALFVAPCFIVVLWLIFRCDFGPLFQGIQDAERLSRGGYGVWFYEPLNNHGTWMFFPVVFFFKTPLTLFVAVLLAVAMLWRRAEGLVTALLAATFMLVSMTSNINLGVRHVMILYPLLCIPAGYGLWRLWTGVRWQRMAALSLALVHYVSFCTAQPEQLAYFNVLAGEHPERITLDSDFDWGQGALMLDDALQRYSIKEYTLCARPNMHWNAQITVKARKKDCPKEKPYGWLAVGRAHRLLQPHIFAWLEGLEAVEPIGKTMDLYYLGQPPAKDEPKP